MDVPKTETPFVQPDYSRKLHLKSTEKGRPEGERDYFDEIRVSVRSRLMIVNFT